MLIGEYTHTIDDKKRVSLPSKFRKELGKTVVMTRGLDNCLFIYGIKEWQTISAKIAELGMSQGDRRGLNRFLLAGAQEVPVDSLGRILVPEYLAGFAGITQKVVFAGVHNRVEVWDEKRWSDYKKKIEKQADMLAEKLGEAGAF